MVLCASYRSEKRLQSRIGAESQMCTLHCHTHIKPKYGLEEEMVPDFRYILV